MGLSFATFINADADQVPIIGSFLAVTLMLVFLSLNGHLMLIAGLVDSFRGFPLDGVAGVVAFDARTLVLAGRELFSLGVTLALPVIAAMLLANLALGVLTRTAPQLNLFAVGFPVTLATRPCDSVARLAVRSAGDGTRDHARVGASGALTSRIRGKHRRRGWCA